MATPRIRRVSSKKEMESTKDDFITQGYEIISEGQNTVLLRKTGWGTTGGHVLWAALTLWWTCGIGNLVYALVYHYQLAEQVLLKLEPGPSL